MRVRKVVESGLGLEVKHGSNGGAEGCKYKTVGGRRRRRNTISESAYGNRLILQSYSRRRADTRGFGAWGQAATMKRGPNGAFTIGVLTCIGKLLHNWWASD